MKEMSKKNLEWIENYEKVSRVYEPKDLKINWLNPPPRDGKCDCCGKNISELKPYGKAGDPLVGDFDGVLLLKRFRREFPYDEKAAKAAEEADKHYADDGCKDPLEWMIKKYGKKEGEGLHTLYSAYCQVGSSWECRDCAVLDEDEYFEVIDRRWSQEV